MKRVTHDCTQGSPEWLSLRAQYFTASEASAMMGDSKYQTRSKLLKAKSTGIAEVVDSGTQFLFDKGHKAEAAARPIVEERIGDELYPATMSIELEGLKLLASLDGSTMMGDIIWENKLLNESLKDDVQQGQLHNHYAYQMEQQLLVSGAEKCYFTTSDGTPEGTFGMWYVSVPELRKDLIAGWKQFAEDLKNYKPEDEKETLVAEVVKDLPAVMVQVSGSVSIIDNFSLFETALRDFVDNKLVRNPQTDQDFVDLDSQIKALKKAEDALDSAEVQMIAQVSSVESMKRTKDMLHKMARDNRLIAEKLLKAKKENIKAEIVGKGRDELIAHVAALHKRIGIVCIQMDISIFAAAISGLKSLDSMREKVSVALANAKIESNAIADLIEANRKTVEDMSLFPDFASVCMKAPDDFAALLSMRTNQRKEAEEKRLNAEREKIRAEEQAKAEANARREAQDAAMKAEVERLAAIVKPAEPVAVESEKPVIPVLQEARNDSSVIADTGKTMKLGDICNRLGFTVTADFLASLGHRPVAIDKNAKLYAEASFKGICSALVSHISNVSVGHKQAA